MDAEHKKEAFIAKINPMKNKPYEGPFDASLLSCLDLISQQHEYELLQQLTVISLNVTETLELPLRRALRKDPRSRTKNSKALSGS